MIPMDMRRVTSASVSSSVLTHRTRYWNIRVGGTKTPGDVCMRFFPSSIGLISRKSQSFSRRLRRQMGFRRLNLRGNRRRP
jgi:hypothetical protein